VSKLDESLPAKGPSPAPSSPRRPGEPQLRSRGEVPPEVLRFLAQSHAQSMMVRGASGSGKTTFALNTLVRFPGRRVYVSCRIERARLRAYFSWVDDPQYQIELIEVDPREEGRPSLRTLRQQWQAPHTNIDSNGVFDRWKWLPLQLQKLWQSLDPARPTLVVIDSWDGFIDTFLEPPAAEESRGGPSIDRVEVERIILRSMALMNAHIMLVVERSEPAPTDYLVDGIVDLETRFAEGRAERWVRIRKLRGVQVDEPEYPFTLDGGDFDIVRPLTEKSPASSLVAEADPGPVAGYLWPGSVDFAEAFGRLPIGHMSLVELDQGVSAAGLRVVLVPMVDAVLRAGGHVLLSIPPTMPVHDFWDVVREHYKPNELARTFRIIASGPGSAVSEEMRGALLQLPDGRASGAPIYQESLSFLRQPPDARDSGNGAFHWHTGLRLLVQSTGTEYTTDSAPRVAQQILADAPLHLMILGQNGDPVFQSLAEMSTIHLRFQDRAGRIFINGVRPRTHSFALSEGYGGVPYRLVRVV
jgi:hypothetical protein